MNADRYPEFVRDNKVFHLHSLYQFLTFFQAREKHTNNLVAIKQILEDENMMNRETNILQMVGEHENLINLKESFYTTSAAGIGSE